MREMAAEFKELGEHDGDSGMDSLSGLIAMSVTGMILVAFVDGKLDWL